MLSREASATPTAASTWEDGPELAPINAPELLPESGTTGAASGTKESDEEDISLAATPEPATSTDMTSLHPNMLGSEVADADVAPRESLTTQFAGNRGTIVAHCSRGQAMGASHTLTASTWSKLEAEDLQFAAVHRTVADSREVHRELAVNRGFVRAGRSAEHAGTHTHFKASRLHLVSSAKRGTSHELRTTGKEIQIWILRWPLVRVEYHAHHRLHRQFGHASTGRWWHTISGLLRIR